jgi:hypothetical protein
MNGQARKGLLLYPEFPDSSFWSYRHIMPRIGAKAAFPPLGLLTFAALMPPEWSFDLIDLNVVRLPNVALRARIAAADAVFVSAMSVQKPSLVAILSGRTRPRDPVGTRRAIPSATGTTSCRRKRPPTRFSGAGWTSWYGAKVASGCRRSTGCFAANAGGTPTNVPYS